MQKFRLQLDNLQIESFSTTSMARKRLGTVQAQSDPTFNYYSCDAQCPGDSTYDVNVTCDLQCGGGGTGGNSMHTACLDCFTNANTCTMVDGCERTRADTCYPCGG